jgi:hypothetical protein
MEEFGSRGVAASIGGDKRKDLLKNKMIRSLTSLPFFLFFKNHKILVQKTKQEKVTSTFILVFFSQLFLFWGVWGGGVTILIVKYIVD